MRKPTNAQDISPKVGHVVLIGDKLKRGQWRIGRITELNVGNDGNVRSAIIKLPSGNRIQRAVKMLYPIEATEASEHTQKQDTRQAQIEASEARPRRTAAVVARNRLQEWCN